MIDFKTIKIVIWDLDDTFWNGTLSEGQISPIQDNIELVKSLTDRGVINSICSKNDSEPTLNRLKEIGADSFFVFPSIDWTPKGPRIQSMLKTMGLRPQNCLFIDDNIQNLNEAKFQCPELIVAGPDVIADMISWCDSIDANDLSHKRLNQYRVLENKTRAAQNFSDNTEFLFSSHIQVLIHRDCEAQIDRIAELVLRSNQLNFTKKRDTKEQIIELVGDPNCDTGYVTVKDDFGDYGMVGFFAVKNNECVHFLFSCRTIGQGVEEYVYATLNYPSLNVVEPVVNHLTKSPAPAWINQADSESKRESTKAKGVKVIFKGGCDLAQMSEYLNTESVCEEFTYMGRRRGNNIEHHSHSVNYLQWHRLAQSERTKLVDELVFNDDEMFDTAMYDDDVSLIIMSTMIEPNLGVYKNKKTGFKIAFGEYTHPLTDPEQWPLYINEQIFCATNKFTEAWLEKFARDYEFCGALTPAEILENAKLTLKKISPNAALCYILGPEIPFEAETNKNYFGREKVYAEINRLFREFSDAEERVYLIDVSKLVLSQSDFTNNINHWQRRIYYKMAQCANEYIAERVGAKVHQKSRLYLAKRTLADKVGRTGLYETRLWRFISKMRNR